MNSAHDEDARRVRGVCGKSGPCEGTPTRAAGTSVNQVCGHARFEAHAAKQVAEFCAKIRNRLSNQGRLHSLDDGFDDRHGHGRFGSQICFGALGRGSAIRLCRRRQCGPRRRFRVAIRRSGRRACGDQQRESEERDHPRHKLRSWAICLLVFVRSMIRRLRVVSL